MRVMKMISLKKAAWALLVYLSVTSLALTQAQGSCPALAQTALANAQQYCQTTGRNQACYGNSMLEVQPQPGAGGFRFSQVGDQVDASAIGSLRLSAMDTASSQWGV